MRSLTHHDRPPRKRLDDDRESSGFTNIEEMAAPEKEFPGTVFKVPNRFWHIKSNISEDHPGVCTSYETIHRLVVLLKGSDAQKAIERHIFVVLPSNDNGLTKPTAFTLAPRYFRHHRVILLYPERRLGHLADNDLQALRSELERVFPNPLEDADAEIQRLHVRI